jgi:hypothetical protein
MSMMKRLFRPGAGATIRSFITAVAEDTIYPHDWVALTGTATSGQGPGADGVFEGKTLGTEDFIYADQAVSTMNSVPGVELGVAMGHSISSVGNIADVSGDSVAADEVFVIQCFGVHPMVQTDGNMTVAVEYLTIGTTAGVADASATINASCRGNVGYGLETDGAYTGAGSETGGAAFIRCGG